MATHFRTLVLFDCACDMDHKSAIKKNIIYFNTHASLNAQQCIQYVYRF